MRTVSRQPLPTAALAHMAASIRQVQTHKIASLTCKSHTYVKRL